jgi:hypothetical protein
MSITIRGNIIFIDGTTRGHHNNTTEKDLITGTTKPLSQYLPFRDYGIEKPNLYCSRCKSEEINNDSDKFATYYTCSKCWKQYCKMVNWYHKLSFHINYHCDNHGFTLKDRKLLNNDNLFTKLGCPVNTKYDHIDKNKIIFINELIDGHHDNTPKIKHNSDTKNNNLVCTNCNTTKNNILNNQTIQKPIEFDACSICWSELCVKNNWLPTASLLINKFCDKNNISLEDRKLLTNENIQEKLGLNSQFNHNHIYVNQTNILKLKKDMEDIDVCLAEITELALNNSKITDKEVIYKNKLDDYFSTKDIEKIKQFVIMEFRKTKSPEWIQYTDALHYQYIISKQNYEDCIKVKNLLDKNQTIFDDIINNESEIFKLSTGIFNKMTKCFDILIKPFLDRENEIIESMTLNFRNVCDNKHIMGAYEEFKTRWGVFDLEFTVLTI